MKYLMVFLIFCTSVFSVANTESDSPESQIKYFSNSYSTIKKPLTAITHKLPEKEWEDFFSRLSITLYNQKHLASSVGLRQRIHEISAIIWN